MRKISRGAYEDTKGLLRVAETLLEILLMTLLYYYFWRRGYDSWGYHYKGKYVLLGIYALVLYALFLNSECTNFGQLRLPDLLVGQAVALFLTNFITYFQLCLTYNGMLSPLPMVWLLAMELILAVVLALLYTRLYHRLYAPHDMLLVFGSVDSVDLKVKMDDRRDKYRVTQFIPAAAGFDAICQELEKHDALILNDVPTDLRDRLVKHCYRHRIRTYVVPELTDIMLRGAKSNSLFDTPLLVVKGTGLSPMERIVKRAMDIVLCGLAMVVAAPIMLFVALAIKLEDGGPVFYKQKRMTRGGREFEILKFRSMIVDAEKYAGAVLATEKDPRITKVGRFIRATRLDEIPQILNILKGDMSIVGPRPERKVLADEIAKELPEFDYRLKVRGGLTGYAQIYGKYNTSARDKLRLDLMYIENYSLLLDIKLIIMTLRIIFSKDATEGADKAEENAQKARALVAELEEQDMTPVG